MYDKMRLHMITDEIEFFWKNSDRMIGIQTELSHC